MLTSEFDYHLPAELIAQAPLKKRTSSRLLCMDKQTGMLAHRHFLEIKQLLRSGDLLVFNNTRVIRARIFAHKSTGGKIEILVERILTPTKVLAHVRSNKAIKIPTQIILPNGVHADITKRCESLFEITFSTSSTTVSELLHEVGELPLPKYIRRIASVEEQERYQTVYGVREGAVAAPTAGLHFDQELLADMESSGIKSAFLTLHVGAGTFKPVNSEYITEHKMHSEYIEVSSTVCQQIRTTRESGGRVIAIGTTTVRALESACTETGEIYPYQGDTNIFIYPGYKFRCIDAMITNFHLPKSTLLMLVCAFGGYEPVFKAYAEAVKHQYRFYSWGDAMWIG